MDLVSLYLETYGRLTNQVTHQYRLPEYHQHHQTSYSKYELSIHYLSGNQHEAMDGMFEPP